MSEHKSEYMSEDDYTALVGAIKQVLDSPVLGDTSYRKAVRAARGIREEFELTRKPDPLPDTPGAVVRVPLVEQLSSLYVRGRDGEWHLSTKRVDTAWLGRYVARHGFEVVA